VVAGASPDAVLCRLELRNPIRSQARFVQECAVQGENVRTTHQLLAGTSPSHAWTLLAVALLCLFGSSCLANPSGDAAATVTQAISLDNEEIGLGGVGIELGSTITPAQLADLAAALAALSADVDDGFEDCEEIEQVLAACGITVSTEDES
jgi:hypothetical protein